MLSRKRTASAMSSGWIIFSLGTLSWTQSVIAVATKPGQSAVHWIPSSASSLWLACVRPTTACLVAEYVAIHGCPNLPAIEAVFTTSAFPWSPPASFRSGIDSRSVR